MNRAEITQGFGSALFGYLRTLLKPILNQRGEVGNPGSDPLEPDPTDANPPDTEPSTDPNPGDQQLDDQSPAAALNTEPDPSLEPDPQSPADTAFHNSTRFQEMNTTIKDTATEIEQLKAQIEQSEKVAQFYQTQFNESQNMGPDGQPAQQQQPVHPGQQVPGPLMEPGQLPENIVAPGNWEDQEQQGAWTEHIAGQRASEMMKQAYQQTLLPMLTQLSNAVASLQQGTAKAGKNDFDEVVAEVNKQIFQTGPDGKVYSVLNPALLNYFRTQSNPYEAMYQHGLTLRAPQKIKEGVQKQTQNTLKKLGKQPVGPTQPRGGDAPGDAPELDWDTPSKETEAILHKRGLI